MTNEEWLAEQCSHFDLPTEYWVQFCDSIFISEEGDILVRANGKNIISDMIIRCHALDTSHKGFRANSLELASKLGLSMSNEDFDRMFALAWFRSKHVNHEDENYKCVLKPLGADEHLTTERLCLYDGHPCCTRVMLPPEMLKEGNLHYKKNKVGLLAYDGRHLQLFEYDDSGTLHRRLYEQMKGIAVSTYKTLFKFCDIIEKQQQTRDEYLSFEEVLQAWFDFAETLPKSWTPTSSYRRMVKSLNDELKDCRLTITNLNEEIENLKIRLGDVEEDNDIPNWISDKCINRQRFFGELKVLLNHKGGKEARTIIDSAIALGLINKEPKKPSFSVLKSIFHLAYSPQAYSSAHPKNDELNAMEKRLQKFKKQD